MSVFYIENENGTYLSENKRRKFIRLQGKEAYNYLKSPEGRGKRFLQTETEEANGEKVYVEIPKEYVNICRKDERRSQYVSDCEKESQIKMVSLHQPLKDYEDMSLEDVVADSLRNLEDEALHEIELEVLRRALKSLTDEELHIIHSLYLANKPISERELSRLTGIPQKTINNRKKSILNKLKNIFKKEAQIEKSCGTESSGINFPTCLPVLDEWKAGIVFENQISVLEILSFCCELQKRTPLVFRTSTRRGILRESHDRQRG